MIGRKKLLEQKRDRSRLKLVMLSAEFYSRAAIVITTSREKLMAEILASKDPNNLCKLVAALMSVMEFYAKVCQVPMSLSKKSIGTMDLSAEAKILSDTELLKHASEILKSEGINLDPTENFSPNDPLDTQCPTPD